MIEPTTPSVSSPPSSGWNGLAQTIARRTTDLLVIGLIVAGGLTVTRQILQWWQAEPPAAVSPVEIANRVDLSAAAAADPLAIISQDGLPVLFRGERYRLSHQSCEGTREQAQTRLVSFCRTCCRDWKDKQRSISTLNSAATLPAVDEKFGKIPQDTSWHAIEGSPHSEIRVTDGPLPMVIGVRLDLQRTQEETGDLAFETKNQTDGNLVSEPLDEGVVICYGFAMPAREQNWSLLLLERLQATDLTSGRLP